LAAFCLRGAPDDLHLASEFSKPMRLGTATYWGGVLWASPFLLLDFREARFIGPHSCIMRSCIGQSKSCSLACWSFWLASLLGSWCQSLSQAIRETLSYWLNNYGGHYTSVTAQLAKNQADEAVRQIGTNAIPFLLKRLQAKDSAFKLWFMRLTVKHNFLNIPLTLAPVKWVQGLGGIKALSLEDAKTCMPQLTELSKNRAYWISPSQPNPYIAAAVMDISNKILDEHLEKAIQRLPL
jgi:hypothetical protein